MKIAHLSFSKQIPESRNSVIILLHFLCYGTPDNIVNMVSPGYLQVELQIFNSLINVFPEWTLSFVYNTTCLKLGKSNDNKRCKCVSYLQQEVLIWSIGQEIWVQEIQYTRTSDTRILTETKNRPDFHMLLLFIITSGLREGSQHSNNVWVNIREQVWEHENSSVRLWGNLPHPCVLLP